MLMIVFGAGASYDSDSNHPPDSHRHQEGRPPLANEMFSETLFAHLFRDHQDCLTLFFRLRKVSDNRSYSIEEHLELIHAEADRYPSVARAIFGLRAYIEHAIRDSGARWLGQTQTRGMTNYVTLLDDVEKWRHDHQETVHLVTFNYDTLIESACAAVLGLRFTDISSYIANPHHKLFKLHGCINWKRLVRNVQGTIPDSLSALEWTDEYSANGHRESANGSTEQYVPAIAVPTLRKGGFECPPAHIEVLTSVIPLVTHLLVIGWRGMEEHFLSLWRKGPTAETSSAFPARLERLQVVSGGENSAEKVRRRLADKAGIRCADERVAGGGFSQFIESGELRSFLFDGEVRRP